MKIKDEHMGKTIVYNDSILGRCEIDVDNIKPHQLARLQTMGLGFLLEGNDSAMPENVFTKSDTNKKVEDEERTEPKQPTKRKTKRKNNTD